MERRELLFELRRLKWLFILAPVFLLLFIFSRSERITEFVYSRGLFLLISNVWNAIFGIFPFSVAEISIYFLALCLPTLLIAAIFLTLSGRLRFVRLLRLVITYIISASVLLASFYVLWGYNYHRQTLNDILEIDVHARSVEELETFCYALADTAKALREDVEEDENGVFKARGGGRASFNKIPVAFDSLGERMDIIKRTVAPPKPVLYSKGLSILGISGIYMPFTAEANVNAHQPDLLMPSSAAHEAAHALGFARENEANFLAYLACMSSHENDIKYSGVMLALIYCGNALHDADDEKYRALRGTYSEGMNRDLADHNKYWDSFEGPASESMEKMNDNYLKLNDQRTGVKSYGEMVDLLLAWTEKYGPGM